MPRMFNPLAALSLLPRAINLFVLMLLVFLASDRSMAQEDSDPIRSVSIGVESAVKLGKWAPVFIEVQPNLAQPPVTYVVSALDGDSTTVNYRGKVTQVADHVYQAWARVGRKYGTLMVRLEDAQGDLIDEHPLNVNSIDLAESTINHLVVMGGNDELESLLKSTTDALYGDSPHTVRLLQDARRLPTQWLGYDGVNSVFLSTANIEQLNAITPEQWTALLQWVEHGGNVLVSCNGTKGELDAQGVLARFLVGNYKRVIEMDSMVRLDNYAKARLDAEELSIAEIEIEDGKTELAYESAPLIVRQVRGMGQIVFFSADITDPVFDSWKGRVALLGRLLEAGELEDVSGSMNQVGSRVSHQGFTDLAGQLRIPLEKFSSVQMVNFTVVAVLIGLYILCIGPGDFFLLKRFAGKMEFTWVSFTLFTLLFCGVAFALSRWSRPQQMQINQLEIIDIDSSSGLVRGNAWANLFSPATEQYRIELDTANSMGVKQPNYLLSWHGTPGDGLGGMQTKAGLSAGQSSYDVSITDDDQGRMLTKLEQVPLQVSSTRSLHAEWTGTFDQKILSNLKFSNSRLVGQLTNPFPFELTNVRVMYGNYAYILDKTLPAGDTIDIGSETNEQTGKIYLTRRAKLADKKDRGQNMPWDPTSSRMDRIADMMMFHEIAGGREYTSLTNDFQDRIEMSDHLFLDRAIFLGEVDSSTCRLTIDGESVEESYDKQLTVIRILLPVD